MLIGLGFFLSWFICLLNLSDKLLQVVRRKLQSCKFNNITIFQAPNKLQNSTKTR